MIFSDELLKEVMDQAMKDVAAQMLHMNLRRTDRGLHGRGGCRFLTTKVSGSYEMILIMQAEQKLWQTIADRMRRGELSECQMEDYAIEYFNVLCGRIVSILNKKVGASSRFKVPVIYNGEYQDQAPSGERQEENFETEQGDIVQIMGIYH